MKTKLAHFIDTIAAERKRQHITQQDMSAKLNINQSTYNIIENHKQQLTALQMLQICDYLNISIDNYFFPQNDTGTIEINSLRTVIDTQRELINTQSELIAELKKSR